MGKSEGGFYALAITTSPCGHPVVLILCFKESLCMRLTAWTAHLSMYTRWTLPAYIGFAPVLFAYRESVAHDAIAQRPAFLTAEITTLLQNIPQCIAQMFYLCATFGWLVYIDVM